MKFSYNWLAELVPGLAADPAELQRLITMKTAECEGIYATGAHFKNVLAARVLDVTPLPKGKNKAVTLDIGSGRKAVVVCGASNVRPGLLAPLVPPGTLLGEKVIEQVAIEGVESEGMLASAAELDINRDHSGVLELNGVEPGERLTQFTPDWIIEIDNKSLTHRPDLWGHLGLAREVAAITHLTLKDPVDASVLPGGAAPIRVEISDYSLCPRYSALLIENLSVEPSPLPLQARLQSIGLNPISNIVDMTNYILAELPQPMHAFDADKLAGDTIFVRLAQKGEKLRALNGETYTLSESDLVIADASGPVALAGVIGGLNTAISKSTTRVVLESANFQPSSVRLTSARHKLRTDASVRFEKSLDPHNTVRGLARALQLLKEICPGARPVGGVTDNAGPAAETKPITLPVLFVIRKLGHIVMRAEIFQILDALGFETTEASSGRLTVTVPSWRATKDVSVKDDLVEEIGRMIGYGEIPPAPPTVDAVVPPRNPMRTYLRQVRVELAAQGFTEIYNYSFQNEADIGRFGLDPAAHLSVQNPIASELTRLRRSLLPGLFKNILDNVRHYREFRIFEIGNEIHPSTGSELPRETTHLAAALYNAHGDQSDFFELKRALECLFPSCCLTAVAPRPFEHPVRAAEINWSSSPIGRIFELQPALLQEEGLEGRAVVFDVDLEGAQRIAAAQSVTYQPLRKYPTSGFDLSVVVPMLSPAQSIHDHLARFAGDSFASVEFVRQYAGPQVAEGFKSVSYHLEVGSLDRTLTSDEASDIRNRIIEGMRGLGFDLRV